MKKEIILKVMRWVLVVITILFFASIFWSSDETWAFYLLLLSIAVLVAGVINCIDDGKDEEISPISKEKQWAAFDFIEEVKKGTKAQFVEEFSEEMFVLFSEKGVIVLDEDENWTAPINWRSELYKWMIYT